jgi:hypothetical protein
MGPALQRTTPHLAPHQQQARDPPIPDGPHSDFLRASPVSPTGRFARGLCAEPQIPRTGHDEQSNHERRERERSVCAAQQVGESPKYLRKVPHTEAEIKAIAASIASIGFAATRWEPALTTYTCIVI